VSSMLTCFHSDAQPARMPVPTREEDVDGCVGMRRRRPDGRYGPGDQPGVERVQNRRALRGIWRRTLHHPDLHPRRGRCHRRRAQVTHRSRRGGSVRRSGGTARPRCGGRRTDLRQVLLNVRFHPSGQHRPDDRRHLGQDGRGLDCGRAELPRHWQDRLPGLSVRRGPAAQREPDEAPSADADARFKPAAPVGATNCRGSCGHPSAGGAQWTSGREVGS
jgi:hypothetical protein